MSTKLFREITRRLKDLGLQAAVVSKNAGASPDFIRDLGRKGTAEPSGSVLKKIAEQLNCTVEDLTGEIPRYNEVIERFETVSINELDVHIAKGVNSSRDVVQIIAAQEAGVVVGTHVYPAESFREAYGFQPDRIRIIPVRGISMEPELWSGQRVMVDIEDKIPSPPGIFVVWDGAGLVLKYVEVIQGSEPLMVRISSAHPAFKPYERTIPDAQINGRVVGVWKRT